MIRWNGNNRATVYVSATLLQATIGAADLVAAGSFPVTVFNAAPGGGSSVPVNFTVAAVPQGSIRVGDVSGAGSSVLMPITLTLDPGASLDGLTFGVHITPNGNAPALTSTMSFIADPSRPTPLPTFSAADIGLFWASFPAPLTGTITLGNLVVPVPLSAVVGQDRKSVV